MARVQIKSEKLTPFGGIFQSWRNLTPCFHLYRPDTGSEMLSIIGYQFSEISRSLMSVYFCGGHAWRM